MKINFWNLFFVFLSLVLVYSNYVLVVPKHYNYYSAWTPKYLIPFIIYSSINIVFLVIYSYNKNKIKSCFFIISLCIMAVTNFWSLFLMNPFDSDAHIIYKDTIWQSHYPEPFYIFIISFLIILLLFLTKKRIDNRKYI